MWSFWLSAKRIALLLRLLVRTEFKNYLNPVTGKKLVRGVRKMKNIFCVRNWGQDVPSVRQLVLVT